MVVRLKVTNRVGRQQPRDMDTAKVLSRLDVKQATTAVSISSVVMFSTLPLTFVELSRRITPTTLC